MLGVTNSRKEGEKKAGGREEEKREEEEGEEEDVGWGTRKIKQDKSLP